jgi:hypothetical protein
MVSRQTLEERGVFACDMEELADRVAELQSTIQVLADRARDRDDLDMHFALGAASRLVFGILRDLVEIDEMLRRDGAIVDVQELLRRRLEEGIPPYQPDAHDAL